MKRKSLGAEATSQGGRRRWGVERAGSLRAEEKCNRIQFHLFYKPLCIANPKRLPEYKSESHSENNFIVPNHMICVIFREEEKERKNVSKLTHNPARSKG
ncbi:hypothetical protein TNIN_458761 [Trichonephila inaurata madagascariensis]|uniref:Uncharacterized protein n=1 Tax=Trichonephila inaurata madagascariensis TaxID=2747483 RepID=A0A8X6XLM8_9ARAC|nr:hypothetical protein TNIN_458761 [Trichonephila inaurata madagascariensis]